MSDSNALSRPLGTNVPLPGGDVVDTPQQRITLPGGGPGGGGTPADNSPQPPGGPAAAGRSAMTFDESRKAVAQWHSRNRAMYEETGKALKQLDHIRKGLERLADKQDVVTMEDVVEEAGKLVAHGIDPVALAGILADAPQEGGGEALGGWVATHAQTAAQGEQAMIVQHNIAKHDMGVSAIHMLMASENANGMMGQMPQPPQQNGNGLLPTGNGGPLADYTPGDYSMGNKLAMGRRFMGRQ